MAVLKAENLIKIYGKGENQVKALNGVSLSVEKGEFVAVVGTSGSGKSTLLHMLGGLDRPDSGKVYIEDKDIFALKEEELTIFRRRKIGFVFQSYNLVPVLSVYENVVLPVELDGKKADRAFVNDILDTLGIREKSREPSGAAFRRAAAARGHCQSAGRKTGDPSVRRAHREPGQPHFPGCTGTSENIRAEIFADHCDDHPQ